jgi:hypothetical protein
VVSLFHRCAGDVITVIAEYGFSGQEKTLTALFTITDPLCDDASVSNLRFGQVDWYDSDGDLRVPNSSWGRLTFQPQGHSTEYRYLNVAAVASDGSYVWLVGNLPIFPKTMGNASVESVDFNIAWLNIASGQDVATINYVYSIDGTIRPEPAQT